jgi:hypothetical protein
MSTTETTERISFKSSGAKRKHRTYLANAAEYAPYDMMKEFEDGATSYFLGCFVDPDHYQGVQKQAFDRGTMAAMRYLRQYE